MWLSSNQFYFLINIAILIYFHKFDIANGLKPLPVYVISPNATEYPYSLNTFKYAADLASSYIISNGILPNYKLTFDYLDSKCNPPETFREFLKLVTKYCHINENNNSMVYPANSKSNTSANNEGFYAIFGPVCSYVLASLSRVNSAWWNAPILTVGGFALSYRNRDNKAFADATDFRYITTFGYNYQDDYHLLMKLFEKHNWKKAAMIGDYRYNKYDLRYCSLLIQSITATYSINSNISFSTMSKFFDNKNPKMAFREFLINTMSNYSIFLLCMDQKDFHEYLTDVSDLGFNNGDYVFINIDLFNTLDNYRRPWLPYVNQTKNSSISSIYRNVLIVGYAPIENEKFENFTNDIVKLSNYQIHRNQVTNFVASFYDSVIIYAKTIQKLLTAGQDIKNGSIVSEAFKNLTHEGLSGRVYINNHGDRQADISLMDFNEATKQFETVGVYRPETNIYHQFREIDWGSKNNRQPLDTPHCGYNNNKCQDKSYSIISIIGSCSAFVVIAVVIGVAVYFQRMKYLAELKAMNWLIHSDELETLQSRYRRISKKENIGSFSPVSKFINKRKKPKISRNDNSSREFLFENFKLSKSQSNGGGTQGQSGDFMAMSERKVSLNDQKSYLEEVDSYHSKMSLDSIAGVELHNGTTCTLYGCYAIYKGSIVALKHIKKEKRVEITRDLLREVKRIKDLNNDHICRFIGACLDLPDQFVVYEYCSKGSLKDILSQKQLVLDWMFRYSLIQDIIRGMIYIHNNIGPHGNLKSSNCAVDSRFVLKITEFGLPSLLSVDKNVSFHLKTEEFYSSMLWTAPEILRNNQLPHHATYKSDVYSFAIVCQEIIYRRGHFYVDPDDYTDNNNVETEAAILDTPTDEANEPLTRQHNGHHISFERRDFDYDDLDSENCTITAKMKYEQVKSFRVPPFRPSLFPTEGCTEDLLTIVSEAWHENPNNRPDFTSIKQAMRKLNKSGDSVNLLDNLLSRMDKYASNLEELVTQRTEQYLEEKRKAETLLYSMLPKSVAHQLIKRQNVMAESYEMVTVYFSDIVGFTQLSADSQPMEIVRLLNKLYTTFDGIIEKYDVYKIETIGDAYVVCSGLPNTNGNKHAREIARMSIAFVKELFTFVIPHRPETQLKLRIGIHSGPVCAGVVGVKMPRYCLFGDTVNTSSRMESNGMPLKIHISGSTKDLLLSFQTFIMTERGYVEMKGKGHQLTYWLHGENDVIVDPVPDNSVILKSDIRSSVNSNSS